MCTQLCLPTSRGTHTHGEPGSRGSWAHTLFFQLQRCPQQWPPSLAATTVPTNPATLEAVEAPVAPAQGIHFSYVHHSSGAHDPGDLDMAEAPAILVLLIVAPVTAARGQ